MENERSTPSQQSKWLLGCGGGLTLLAAIGWSLSQRSKNQDLFPALNGERIIFPSKSAGKLSYYADKSGFGRPLVLIHSINAAGSAFEMKPLFEHFQGIRPVYALDLPGYGFSDRSNRAYLPSLYSDLILEFLANELQEEADIFALSLSSEFVARVAIQRPELIHSITLVSPTGFNPNIVELPTDLLYRSFTFPLWKKPFFRLLTSRTTISYYSGLSFVGECPSEFIDYAYATSHQPGAENAPYYFVSGKMFTPTVRTDIYENVNVPVLVIYDEDPNVKFDKLPDLLAKKPNWHSVRLVPSLGLPHWEILDETVNTLQAFWNDI